VNTSAFLREGEAHGCCTAATLLGSLSNAWGSRPTTKALGALPTRLIASFYPISCGMATSRKLAPVPFNPVRRWDRRLFPGMIRTRPPMVDMNFPFDPASLETQGPHGAPT
jgi:hypothetical protein